MIGEVTRLNANEQPLLDLSIFVSFAFPEYAITPSWHSLLLACIIVLGTLIILIGWGKIHLSFCECSIELILKFTYYT